VPWFWAIYVPALLMALASLRGERKRARYYARAREPGRTPPATLIVPVKGVDEGLKENLASLAALDYPDYELIVAARSAEDVPGGVVPARARLVLAGGGDPQTCEKNLNLTAAVAAARPESEVFAFADSDGRVQRGWLRALAAALDEPGAGASTGYRWYVPAPPDFWSLMRSVWNAGIFGQLGPDPAPFTWGGAMAIRRETFFRLRIPDCWKGQASDDYTLARAVRDAGLKIVYTPGGLVESADHVTAGEFFRWARRQLMFTRKWRPDLWRMALVSSIVYCAGMGVCAVAAVEGNLVGEYALLALLMPGMLKGQHRAALARSALPERAAWFKRHGWVHTWFAPLGTWVWLATVLSSAWGRSFEWRGRSYRL
jgi:cellulose synthase/poly-beta-1,6-N-acetylglucosamine synthase-like glycosyltransferase